METDYITGIKERIEKSGLPITEILKIEVDKWHTSERKKLMEEAENYYRNRSIVQTKRNTLRNRSNTRIEHPILRKLIEQKVNYLLSNSWSIKSEDNTYTEELNNIFDDRLRQSLKSWGKEAIKKGIGFVQIYFDDDKLRLKRIPSEQIIPYWADEEHTKLEAIIRIYGQTVYKGRYEKDIARIEYYDDTGVKYFVSESGEISFDVEKGIESCHFICDKKGYNWSVPPFLWIKYTEEELPLFYFIKELIDDINWQESVTADLLRDIANFIYIIKNYSGTDPDEVIKELKEKLMVLVEGDGDVDKLTADMNIDAVMKLLDKHRRDIYDYARSVDTQDPRLGDASGQALKFRYADLDMDCNDLEAEIQLAFENMKVFIDDYLILTGKGNFKETDFEVAFKRDVIVNESEIIDNVVKSRGHISDTTRVARHPWVENAEKELELIEEEKQEALEQFGESLFDESFKLADGKAVAGNGEKGKDDKKNKQ